MPPGRSNRGGRRQGTPGKSYSNRVDLQSHQPVRTAPGQAYGVATQQAQAQQAMPLPGGAANAGPSTPPPPGPLGGMPPLGTGPLPGSLGPLHAPTGRPNEPVTHGLPTGPGAGPEILQPPNPLVKAAAVLNNLGGAADADTARLRNFVNASLGNQGAA